MAVIHFKVEVYCPSSDYAPQYQDDGCVLITVMTGTTQSAVASAITSGTSIHYQITGKYGSNDFWISTGPNSIYAGVSCAKLGYQYYTQVKQISTASTTTFSLTLTPSAACRRYVRGTFINAINTYSTTPNSLRLYMTSFTASTSGSILKLISAESANTNYNKLFVADGNGEDSSKRLVCGRRINWNVSTTGSIYKTDPGGQITDLRLTFSPDSFTVANNSAKDLRFNFTLFINGSSMQSGATTVGNFASEINAGGSNSDTIQYVAKNWTPTSTSWGIKFGNLTDTSTYQETYCSYVITLITNVGNFTFNYYSGNHEGIINPALPSSGTVVVSSIAIEFTT